MVPSGLAQSTGEAKLCESGDPLNLALVGVLDFDRWSKESSAAVTGNSGGDRDGDGGGGGGLYEASNQGFTTCVGVVVNASSPVYFNPWSETTLAQ